MPFDDLKPTPVAWAVESQRGIEGLYILQAVACDRASHFGEECRAVPLYAAPVAVRDDPRTPVLPSEFNAAADVARATEQRHDAPTCCGERQEPDVGEGWRELRVGDVVQVGDEFFNGREWHVTTIGGGQIGPRNFPYRRRVTPVVQVESMSITATWAAEVARLSAENHLLKSEVERLRLTLPAVVCEATKRAIDEIIQLGGGE